MKNKTLLIGAAIIAVGAVMMKGKESDQPPMVIFEGAQVDEPRGTRAFVGDPYLVSNPFGRLGLCNHNGRICPRHKYVVESLKRQV